MRIFDDDIDIHAVKLKESGATLEDELEDDAPTVAEVVYKCVFIKLQITAVLNEPNVWVIKFV